MVYRYSEDLGDNHILHFTSWKPDRELNDYEGLPDIERLGATIEHVNASGEFCMGHITFEQPGAEVHADRDHRWDVISWEPLTVTPSILCRICGDHGFISDGKWIRA